MLKKKVIDIIFREKLIDENDNVLVALSGGADSVSLLHILNSIKNDVKIKNIYAFHLNHQIRWIDSHKDASFSYDICKKLNIPCFLKSYNVLKYSKENKISVEEAAREVRYNFLFQIKEKLNINKIAVAHNLDDQCETIIMRLFRGTGTSGLRGMDYFNKNNVIRPLLDIKREEIEEYCISNDINFINDNTNFEDVYTRNKIRLKLIPYIEKNFSYNFKNNIFKLSKNIREEDLFIDNIVKKIFDENVCIIDDDTLKFDVENIKSFDKVIQKRIIKKSYEFINKGINGLENIHVDDGIKVLDSEKTNVSIDLPNGVVIEKAYNDFYIGKTRNKHKVKNIEYLINIGDKMYLSDFDLYIETKIVDRDKTKRLNTSSSTSKSFDYDKIKGNLIIRNRKEGDKIKILGLGGTKKIKDIFIDNKIPNAQKDNIPILSDENKIIWIYGYQMSDEAKIDENTTKILRVDIYKKELGGNDEKTI